MPDKTGMPLLEVDSVECSPLDESELVVRVSGAWNGRQSARRRALLVVHADGRRHRFPAIQRSSHAGAGGARSWCASFTIPSWLGHELDGNLSLLFAGEREEVPLPATSPLGTAASRPAQISLNGRAKVERRPPRNAATNGAGAMPQPPRVRAAGAELRHDVEQLRAELAQERKEREHHESTARTLAAKIADTHAKNLELIRERDDLALEREHLAAELQSLREELLATHERHAGANGVLNGHAAAVGPTA